MYILNVSNPLVILFFLMFTVLFIILGKEFKRSILPAIMLIVYLILLVVHLVQVIVIEDSIGNITSTLYGCITMDFIFIFLSYISYLWVDDIEAKFKNKKSIDNSLEWFWKKV